MDSKNQNNITERISRRELRITLICAVGISCAALFICWLLAINPARQSAIAIAHITDEAAYAQQFDAKSDESLFSMKTEYRSMDLADRFLYRKMYVASSLMRDSVFLDGCDSAHAFDVFIRMFYDSPELFYLNCKARSEETTTEGVLSNHVYTKFHFDYGCGINEVAEMRKNVSRVAKECLDEIAECESYSAKASTINDFLIKRVEYSNDSDIDYLSAEDMMAWNPAHTVLGSLVEGKAVCEGYAQAYTLLCREAGLSCYTIVGDVPQSKANALLAHAWNAIMTEEGWRYVDVTRNDSARYPNSCLLMDDQRCERLG